MIIATFHGAALTKGTLGDPSCTVCVSIEIEGKKAEDAFPGAAFEIALVGAIRRVLQKAGIKQEEPFEIVSYSSVGKPAPDGKGHDTEVTVRALRRSVEAGVPEAILVPGSGKGFIEAYANAVWTMFQLYHLNFCLLET